MSGLNHKRAVICEIIFLFKPMLTLKKLIHPFYTITRLMKFYHMTKERFVRHSLVHLLRDTGFYQPKLIPVLFYYHGLFDLKCQVFDQLRGLITWQRDITYDFNKAKSLK